MEIGNDGEVVEEVEPEGERNGQGTVRGRHKNWRMCEKMSAKVKFF